MPKAPKLTVRKKSSHQPKKAPIPKLTSNKEPADKPPRPRPKPKKVSNASLDDETAQVVPQDDNATLPLSLQDSDAAETLASLKHTPNLEPQGDYAAHDHEICDSDVEVDELDDSSDDGLEEHDLSLPVESPSVRRNTAPGNASKEIFKISIEVPYRNATRDVTGITSATSYERAMRLIAERMDVGPSRMAAIGYIPSYKPKSPKPVAKLLEDEEAWDRLIEDIRAYIDSFAIKRGASRSVKPFVISIVDTLGVDPKESKSSSSSKKKKGPDTEAEPALSRNESNQMDKLALIEKKHYCQKCRKPCVLLRDGQHYELTINDLSKWSLLVADGVATITDVPDELNIGNAAKVQYNAKKAAAKTAVVEQTEPPQWMQQMLGLMMMRDLQPQARSFGGPSQSHSSPPTPTSSPPKRTTTSADVPTLVDWFEAIKADPSRKLSNAADFLDSLRQQDIEDLSDLVNFTAQELVTLAGMTIGLAKRLLGYAKNDMAAFHKPKRSRQY